MLPNDGMTYQIPPAKILEWADADLPPVARINSKGSHIIFLKSNRYKSLAELYEPELKLAGIRINPNLWIPSRSSFYTNIQVQSIDEKAFLDIQGLPDTLKIYDILWSPDETKIALTILGDNKLELWVIHIATGEAKRITDTGLNGVLTTPMVWCPDSQSLLVLCKSENPGKILNREHIIPTEPIISEGHMNPSQHRTYQDLLKDKTDEFNFSILAKSTLKNVTLSGDSKPITEGMIDSLSVSPDGSYLLMSEVVKPFSYHVPYHKFPKRISILDFESGERKIIQEIPLQDQIPKGFMAVHPYNRSYRWRNNRPAVLTFCKALDNGDPTQEVPYRDELFQWQAPFVGEPEPLIKTVNRYSHVLWSSSGYALAIDYWYDTRNSKTYLFYPDCKDKKTKIIFDRDVQDRYGDPGTFVTEKNKWGRAIIGGDAENAYLEGEGYRADGIHPFIDKYNLSSGSRERLWEAENKDELLRLGGVLDLSMKKIIVRKESATEFPNYHTTTWDKPKLRNYITNFMNPFNGLNDIQKSIIYYKRNDGTELHATLYLPLDQEPGVKYPLLMWAYPEEYTNGDLAGQITSSDNEFTYPWYGSPIFWVRRGYAVLDNVSFPIIGSEARDINDSFITQLKDNATAAINAVCKDYPINVSKIAVGGHSYGAFMTANLLTWTNLFAAGIARSGAYNRTLTPFGFQGEQRTYWEAPELYHKMSPFSHADKMKTPLLLIHGQMDNNSGTHTIQSQRYFDALKSLGAEVRLVLLPKESHSYLARESILHVLWEQDRWLEKYLKPPVEL